MLTLRYAGWLLALIPVFSVAVLRWADRWRQQAYHLGDAAAINLLDRLDGLSIALLFALFVLAPVLLLWAVFAQAARLRSGRSR